ncbi:glycosyltransferase family 2 protein [Desulfovibrio sp. OttesenSCG-928-C14]|nr:glycosyltransferase family 2 protein [Desulfovibrio sp. OttesenSCG-928-C14]
MILSIVTTLYRSEAFIEEFHSRISAVARLVAEDDYELVFVDDGSPDKSLERAVQLAQTDPHVKVVELSRNFGHHKAILAGLAESSGEVVYLTDVDLEEQPEWLLAFKEQLDDSGADVVYGVQEVRSDAKITPSSGALFWKMLNLFSDQHIPANPMTCRLMTRPYVNALLSVGDRVLFLAGTFAWAGFKQVPLHFTKSERPDQSKSSYSLTKRFALMLNSMTSFSAFPLYCTFCFGFAISVCSFALGVFYLLRKIIYPEYILSGFTTQIVIILFLGGVIITSIGLVGIYVAKIFQEVKRRPLYIIRKIHGTKKCL